MGAPKGGSEGGEGIHAREGSHAGRGLGTETCGCTIKRLGQKSARNFGSREGDTAD